MPEVVSIASTDPDDTILGAGANTVTVGGLCDLGCIHTETIELNGQTPVDTVRKYSRVFRVMNTSKEGHDLQGQLYVGPKSTTWTGGEPDHVLAHVNNGNNQTQMALYTVPAGYTLLIYNVVVCSHKDKEMEVGVYARGADINDLSNSMVMGLKINWLLYRNIFVNSLGLNPFTFPEHTDFEFRAKNLGTGSERITANATGLLIPNKYITGAR